MNNLYKKKGFTLIELMVVISIIGIMSSVILSALNDARAKARDAQRIQALKEIQKALTLYYDDNGNYPIYNTDFGILSSVGTNWSSLGVDLSQYLTQIPRDPINNRSQLVFQDGYAYFYRSSDDGDDYDLITWLETNNSLRCADNDWYSNVGLSTFFGPGYWCTSTNFPYAWIQGRDNIYDITR